MSPRAYDRRLRQAASDEARRRIVEAAAALHAEVGGTATSHAMIAGRAGVSIPTVYKYFPTAGHLIPACTGLVAGRAPVALDETLFEGKDGLAERVHAVAAAMFRLHEYYAPWMRWGAADAASFPELRDYFQRVQDHQIAIIRLALTPKGASPPSKSLVLFARILLDAPSWHKLAESTHSTERAARSAADAILTIARHLKEKP